MLEQQTQTRPGSRGYETLQFNLLDQYMQWHLVQLERKRTNLELLVDADHKKHLSQLQD